MNLCGKKYQKKHYVVHSLDEINPATYHTPSFKVGKFITEGYKIDLGERILEVLSTPGHTPDAISVLDRELGLLWVGDIYYDGPIWLFAPESDFDAYYQSVELLISTLVETWSRRAFLHSASA